MRLKWLVENADRPLVEVIDELTPTIPDLLWGAQVAATGPYRWSVEADEYGQLWVLLDVDTRPWHDPVRTRARRSTTP